MKFPYVYVFVPSLYDSVTMNCKKIVNDKKFEIFFEIIDFYNILLLESSIASIAIAIAIATAGCESTISRTTNLINLFL